MRRKSKSSISKGISNIVIALVVMLSLGFLFVFTNNFTTPLKNFYVKCGNVLFTHEFENFNLTLNKEYKFEIHNTLESEDSGYSILIKPNITSATTFTFKVDETETKFADVQSLSKGFSLVAYEDYFTLTANMDLPEILQLYYPDSTLTDVPSVVDSGFPCFTLVISSSDLQETINIHFNLKSEVIYE